MAVPGHGSVVVFRHAPDWATKMPSALHQLVTVTYVNVTETPVQILMNVEHSCIFLSHFLFLIRKRKTTKKKEAEQLHITS